MRLILVIVVAVVLGLAIITPAAEFDRREAERLTQMSSPESAQTLRSIIDRLFEQKSFGLGAHLMISRLVYESTINQENVEQKILRLERLTNNAPRQVQPIFLCMKAEWLLDYFSQNRFEFSRQRINSVESTNDLSSWNVATLLNTIETAYRQAMTLAQEMKLSTLDYAATLAPAHSDERITAKEAELSPTLCDFIAGRLLRFYELAENSVFANGDSSLDELNSFTPAPVFLTQTIQPRASDDYYSKSLRLYQSILERAQSATNKLPYHYWNVNRLKFVARRLDAEEEGKLFGIVHRLWEEHQTEPDAAPIAVELVSLLLRNKKPAQALQVAKNAALLRRSSLTEDLERRVQYIGGEEIMLFASPILPSSATFQVWTRNIRTLYFRAYAIDFEKHLVDLPDLMDPSLSFNPTIWDKYLMLPPQKSWSMTVSNNPSFFYTKTDAKAPLVKPGFYLILTSSASDFTNGTKTMWPAWFSDIMAMDLSDTQRRSFAVVQAITGEPRRFVNGYKMLIEDEKDPFTIAPLKRNRAGDFLMGTRQKEDEEGTEDFPFLFKSGRSRLIIPPPFSHSPNESMKESVMFLTDRPLYRPGQRLRFKGIYMAPNIKGQEDPFGIEPKKELVINLTGPSGKIIGTSTNWCNEYGSFSGSFQLPRTEMPGGLYLNVAGIPAESPYLSLEEYKRPKLFVELKDIPPTAKLNSPLEITGKVTAYSGANVARLKGSYTITREITQYPYSWRADRSSRDFTAGGLVTEGDGTFKIPLLPKVSFSPGTTHRSANFKIEVKITDETGETRTASRECLLTESGFSVFVSAAHWANETDPVVIEVKCMGADRKPRLARGSLIIYPVVQPAVVPDVQHQRVPELRYLNEDFLQDERLDDSADFTRWPTGPRFRVESISISTNGLFRTNLPLEEGMYRLVAELTDETGEKASSEQTISVLGNGTSRSRIKLPLQLQARETNAAPGQKVTYAWSSGYPSARVRIDIQKDERVLYSGWSKKRRNQEVLSYPVTPDLRGGFTIRARMIRNNVFHEVTQLIDVPWSAYQFFAEWREFQQALAPGEETTFSARILDDRKQPLVAEVLALAYDASLDELVKNSKYFGLSSPELILASFPKERPFIGQSWRNDFFNLINQVRFYHQENWGDVARYGTSDSPLGFNRDYSRVGAPGPWPVGAMSRLEPWRWRMFQGRFASAQGMPPAAGSPFPDLSRPTVIPNFMTEQEKAVISTPRRNFDETAFFLAHLRTDTDGIVRIPFKMPESLTRWKVRLFAHDAQLRCGLLESEIQTQKELMVEPAPPRFVRQGDALEFPVRVSNTTSNSLSALVKLEMTATAPKTTNLVEIEKPERRIELQAGESKTLRWPLNYTNLHPLTFAASARNAQFQDAEVGSLPVLPKKVSLTEGLPLFIPGPGEKSFQFSAFEKIRGSASVTDGSFEIEAISNPIWLAIGALPWLSQFPHECSEQMFNRFYANALSWHLLKSYPGIAGVFADWKTNASSETGRLAQKLSGTPWASRIEETSKLGLVSHFDNESLAAEISQTWKKVVENQRPDGAWSWFPGARPSPIMTFYLTAGFGKLKGKIRSLLLENVSLEADGYNALLAGPNPSGRIARPDQETVWVMPALVAVRYIDAWLQNPIDWKDGAAPSWYEVAAALYARSFFLEEAPIPEHLRGIYNSQLQKAEANLDQIQSIQARAHWALIFHRFGKTELARRILRELAERAIRDPENGMHWPDIGPSWSWFHRPIETQAALIEAFAEVTCDAKIIEECQLWLLKQKRTQHWPTTTSTADAIYALLINATNRLSDQARLQSNLGTRPVDFPAYSAGAGFASRRFEPHEIKADFSALTLIKTNPGPAWGGARWNYFEDLDKIPSTGPMRIKKSLFVKRQTGSEITIAPVTGPVRRGDEIWTRLEFTCSENMDFVHLRDWRASGLEPQGVVSRYKSAGGLYFYETTRDTATDFYFERIGKGSYTIDYPCWAAHSGGFQAGYAQIECMYAPEFSAHSASTSLAIE